MCCVWVCNYESMKSILFFSIFSPQIQLFHFNWFFLNVYFFVFLNELLTPRSGRVDTFLITSTHIANQHVAWHLEFSKFILPAPTCLYCLEEGQECLWSGVYRVKQSPFLFSSENSTCSQITVNSVRSLASNEAFCLCLSTSFLRFFSIWDKLMLKLFSVISTPHDVWLNVWIAISLTVQQKYFSSGAGSDKKDR